MNKNKLVFMTVSMLFVLSIYSCTKILEADPTHQIDGSNGFKTIDDYNFALIGTYKLFQQPNYYGATPDANGNASNAYVLLPDILSDNFNESGESLGNFSTLTNWVYAEDEPNIGATWQNAYAVIAQANIVLRGIDNLTNADPLAINRVKGQALAIRAMAHFDILRYWVNDFDRNSTSPGIPYISSFDYNVKPSRGTVKETYDNIEADLQQAKRLLSNTDQPVNENKSRAYMDSSVVNAVSARMYLYANEPDSAIKYAIYVINEFPLAKGGAFEKIWTDESNAEVIWSVAFNSGEDNIGGNVYFAPSDRSSYAPNETLLDTYDASDVRYDAYFKVKGGRLILSKYLAKASQLADPDGIVNFKAFRTGEMYLIRAEAYARTGNDAEALNDLNTLRAARINNFTPGTETGTELIDAIAMERRKELIGEGHRWFDLKRTTRTIDRTFCEDFCTLNPPDREWAWPIPNSEINANPNILPQNTGYQNYKIFTLKSYL